MGLYKDTFGLTIFYSDSQAVIAYVNDFKYHGKTKHIDTKNNFIRDIIAQKELIPKYLPTWKVVVDPFTKSISRDMFFVHVKPLGFLSYNLCWLYDMDHYWLDIRYSVND